MSFWFGRDPDGRPRVISSVGTLVTDAVLKHDGKGTYTPVSVARTTAESTRAALKQAASLIKTANEEGFKEAESNPGIMVCHTRLVREGKGEVEVFLQSAGNVIAEKAFTAGADFLERLASALASEGIRHARRDGGLRKSIKLIGADGEEILCFGINFDDAVLPHPLPLFRVGGGQTLEGGVLYSASRDSVQAAVACALAAWWTRSLNGWGVVDTIPAPNTVGAESFPNVSSWSRLWPVLKPVLSQGGVVGIGESMRDALNELFG